ncbi:MAG: Malate dehydrogenase [Methanobacterium sp. PtaU1.Bin242]|nr:MAG: Malate dehydrogenase [Methanobacterium sp. PtaU1.Bin242]
MKVSVIGASGRVGKAAAFCLAEENVVNKLVLISRKDSIEKIEGESLDMYDAMAAKDIRISIKSSCNMEDLHDSDVVVITAGVPRRAGMSRSEIAIPNAKIVAEYSRIVAEHSPHSIILVVTNPVDVMTYVALKASGFDRNKVFGLGNHLDSLRLRNMLAKHFNIHVSEIHTRVIGEHGDHMVPLVSSTSIGGILLKNYALDGTIDMEGMVKKVINAGSYVINKKGSTEYGPAYAIANIVNTILNDEKKILTVSAYLDGEIEDIKDVCLGVPVKLGINGIERIIPIKMNENETKAFKNAANIVKMNTERVMDSLEI